MFDFNLFHLAFLGQVLILSWYYPRKLLGQMQFVADNYPVAEYPKLYPKPAEDYAKSRKRFRLMNTVVLLSGFVLLVWFMTSTRDTGWDGPRITWYYLLQMLPVLLLDLSALKELRLMRLADESTTRQAELKPRRLFEYLSARLLGLAVVMYIVFCLFIIFLSQFDFPWFGGYLNIVIVTAVNLAIVVAGWRMLRGRKLDPHQSPEDRKMKIQNILTILVLSSIMLTSYVILTITLSALDMRYLQPTTLSIYYLFLSVICFQAYRIDGRNFEVYRDTAQVS